MTNQVKIFDTTLRDGEQALPASLSVKENLQIALAKSQQEQQARGERSEQAQASQAAPAPRAEETRDAVRGDEGATHECIYNCGFIGTEQVVAKHEEKCTLRRGRLRIRSKAPPAGSSSRREEVPQQEGARRQEEAAHMQDLPWRKVDEDMVVAHMKAVEGGDSATGQKTDLTELN